MRYQKYCCVIILLLILLNLINGEIKLGNISENIDNKYYTSQNIKGWINISIINESSNSFFEVFGRNISITEFLLNTSSEFSCDPDDCKDSYFEDNPKITKEFVLDYANNNIIGLKLTGTLESFPISSISFNVETNNNESCIQPLKIDVLTDGNNEWYSTYPLNDFVCSESYGCFNFSESNNEYQIGLKEYCEKISVPNLPIFKIGAYIVKGNSSYNNFTMSVYDSSKNKISDCIIGGVNETGEYECTVLLKLKDPAELYVCIKSDFLTDYKLKSENKNPCGIYGIESDSFSSDYSIFVKGGKYSKINSFNFNNNEFLSLNDFSFANYVNNYLLEKYNLNCTKDCIVPIKISSGVNDQKIILSNLSLTYDTKQGSKSESNFYDLTKKSFKINSGFIKINLENSNFYVPDRPGNYTLTLRFNNKDLVRKNITVLSKPVINNIYPTEIPALVLFKFYASTDKEDNFSYSWNFGDGNMKTTNTNYVEHVYTKIGIYDLTLKIINNLGIENQKSMKITVISPKNAINLTIKEYNKNLENLEKEISFLPLLLKNEISKRINLDNLRSSLLRLENQYENAFTDSDYVEVMTELLKLKIPAGIKIKNIINSTTYYQNEEQIDFEVLKSGGIGELKGERELYISSINNYLKENIIFNVESKSYYFYFKYIGDELISTHINLDIRAKNQLNNLYLIINGLNNTIIDQSLNQKNIKDSKIIKFENVFSNIKTGFLYNKEIEFLNLPFYFSPDFKNLSISEKISVECNNNNKCESSLNENYKNCRTDCKPIGLSVLYLSLLFCAALIVYIILQEWYKRYYEKSLFKDRNELFNLVNFMNNCEVQGFLKNEMFSKLREFNWSNEQITYVWKKLHGKRTGMWEIPIFKFIENLEVKREIKKRQTNI
jgi:hypothetical protein